jgi:hypothetical protein
VSFIADFEMIMAREARIRQCDGVVCGHIHKAEIRDIDGLLYCNDGDWVESLTALVETANGALKIVHWPHILPDPIAIPHLETVTVTVTSTEISMTQEKLLETIK